MKEKLITINVPITVDVDDLIQELDGSDAFYDLVSLLEDNDYIVTRKDDLSSLISELQKNDYIIAKYNKLNDLVEVLEGNYYFVKKWDDLDGLGAYEKRVLLCQIMQISTNTTKEKLIEYISESII